MWAKIVAVVVNAGYVPYQHHLRAAARSWALAACVSGLQWISVPIFKQPRIQGVLCMHIMYQKRERYSFCW
jgi:hypothetical protein